MVADDTVFDESIFYAHKQLNRRVTDHRKIIGADIPQDKQGDGVKIAIIESNWFDCEGDTKSSITQTTKDRLSQKNPETEIANGHINFVASIIAGKNGIAPQAQLEVIRYEGFSKEIGTAIRQAIEAKVDFINMSVGFGAIGSDFPQELRQPLLEARDAGICILLAAGNENHLVSTGVTLGLGMYKGLDKILEEMNGYMRIVVSTSYEKKKAEEELDFCPYSYKKNKGVAKDGYGQQTIEEKASYFSNSLNAIIAKYGIAAPGDLILAHELGSKPKIDSGTSFATPIVVAAAALVKSNFPHLKNVDVLNILEKSARKKDNPRRFGQGVIDIPAAFKLAMTYNHSADSGE